MTTHAVDHSQDQVSFFHENEFVYFFCKICKINGRIVIFCLFSSQLKSSTHLVEKIKTIFRFRIQDTINDLATTDLTCGDKKQNCVLPVYFPVDSLLW